MAASFKFVKSLNGTTPDMFTFDIGASAVSDGQICKFSSGKLVDSGTSTSGAFDVLVMGDAAANATGINTIILTPGLVLEGKFSTGTPALGASVEMTATGITTASTGTVLGKVIEIKNATTKVVNVLVK